MKNIIIIFVFSILLFGCNNNPRAMYQLAHIDSVIEKNPQVAYDSLCSFRKSMNVREGSKVEMKYRLLMAKVQNKLYKPMPSDSLFREVVDYYDGHGTSNEKMEAHYLQGCIFRDMKEAPMAIQCYQEAVECADTLSKECDYTTLFSIYGQMAEIFKVQNLSSEAKTCYKWYCYYALKSKDLYNYIRGKEFIGDVYYDEGDTVKAMEIAKECVRLYENNNMAKEAAAALSNIISVCLSRQDYVGAKNYIRKYETESHLFDGKKILVGREQHYYNKGLCYLGENKVDSAEICFRKLLGSKCLFEAYKGLAAVYRTRQDIDSVKRYSWLCEKTLDGVLRDNQMEAVEQASSMYNYDRMQRQMNENALKLERNRWCVCVAFILVILLSLFFYKRYKRKILEKQQELERKNIDYLQTKKRLEELQDDIIAIKENSIELLSKKEKEMVVLKEKLLEIEKENEKMKPSEKDMLIEANEVYMKFIEMSSGKLGSPVPQVSDWKSLFALVKKYYPLFYNELQERNVLSAVEWKVCMLVRLKFKSGRILLLLGKSSSIVSNAKKSANKKLFGIDNAASLYKNMLNMGM